MFLDERRTQSDLMNDDQRQEEVVRRKNGFEEDEEREELLGCGLLGDHGRLYLYDANVTVS